LKDKTLTQVREGSFQPEYSEYRLSLRGATWKQVAVDGAEPIELEGGENVTLPEGFKEAVFS